MRSLNVRLALYLLLPFVVLLPLGAVLQYFIALIPIRAALDSGLENVAIAVSATVDSTTPSGADVPNRDFWTERSDPPFVAVIGPDGRLIAGDARLLRSVPSAAVGETRIMNIIGLEDLHMAVRGVRCGAGVCQVRVAEPMAPRERLERNLLLGSVASMVGLLLLIGIVMWFGARDSLAPVRALRRQMESRSLDDLAPVAIEDPPEELVPIVDAINDLFARLKQSAEANQAFVAAASHQFRTPLARLTARLELALQQARDGPADQTLLADMKQAIDRMSRLTHQLLSLARSGATARPVLVLAHLDLKDLALQAGSSWVPRAAELGIDLGFEVEPAVVSGHAQLLGELLANLIDNALRYGARRVTVRTRAAGARCELEVEDDGSGIAAGDRERVFQRFARGSSSQGEGTGLGLAIVRQIAHFHGGDVELRDSAGGGLRVLVTLPSVANRPQV